MKILLLVALVLSTVQITFAADSAGKGSIKGKIKPAIKLPAKKYDKKKFYHVHSYYLSSNSKDIKGHIVENRLKIRVLKVYLLLSQLIS